MIVRELVGVSGVSLYNFRQTCDAFNHFIPSNPGLIVPPPP